jgi:hypothetical protein
MQGYSDPPLTGADPPYQNYNNFDAAFECFKTPLYLGGPGFTDECAYVWASNGANSALPKGDAGDSCTDECTALFGDPLGLLSDPTTAPVVYNDKTCALVDCIDCDEESSGELFKMYAGRTRRNSGILTSFQFDFDPRPSKYWYGLKRPCGDIAVIQQKIPDDFLACLVH